MLPDINGKLLWNPSTIRDQADMNPTKSFSNSLTKVFRSLHLQYHHNVRSPNSRLYQSSNLYNEFIEFMPNIKMYGIIFWVFSISDKNFRAYFGSIFRTNHWSRICAGCIYSLLIFWSIVTILYIFAFGLRSQLP